MKRFKERPRNCFRLIETTRTGQLCDPVFDPLAIKDVIELFDNTCMEPLDWMLLMKQHQFPDFIDYSMIIL